MYVYLMKCSNFYKIGYSKNPKSRRATIQTHNPLDVKICATLKTDAYQQIEKMLHQRFVERRFRGEWFELKEEDLLELKIDFGFSFKIKIESINEDENFENSPNSYETKQIRNDNHKIESIKAFFESTFQCEINNPKEIRKCCLKFDEENIREAVVGLFTQDKTAYEAYSLLYKYSKSNEEKDKNPIGYVIKVIKAIYYKRYDEVLEDENLKFLESVIDFDTDIDQMVKTLNTKKYYLENMEFWEFILKTYGKSSYKKQLKDEDKWI